MVEEAEDVVVEVVAAKVEVALEEVAEAVADVNAVHRDVVENNVVCW